MNTDILSGQWKQLKGKVKEQWGKLTEDDLTTVDGHRDKLLGRIQERYGVAKDDAERQLTDFEKKFSPSLDREQPRR